MPISRPTIAIIGAGIAGLTLARELRGVADVKLFEKARGVGGRMATRRTDAHTFDHGTQFFTARSRAFRDFLEPWKKAGVVFEWTGDVVTLERGQPPKERIWFEPHFVAAPTMTSLCKGLAEGLDIALATEIAPFTANDGPWALTDKQGAALGSFDWVISTAPPVQTTRLFGDALPAENILTPVELQGCYALMVGFDRDLGLPWIGAKVEHSPLGWVSVNSSKPGRGGPTAIVAHSRNDWAEEHLEMVDSDVQALLLQELEAVTGIDVSAATQLALHRWRYALVAEPTKPGPYLDAGRKLAAVGDWSVTSRIEESWYASMDLVEKLRRVI